MKKKIGVVGFRGKLGCLLLERPNFVPIDCDVTDIESISQAIPPDVDLLIDLEEITDVPDWSISYSKAIRINVRGLYNLHRVFGERVITISHIDVGNGRKLNNSPYLFSKFGSESISITSGGMIIRIPPLAPNNTKYIANQIESLANKPFVRKSYIIRLGLGFWKDRILGNA